MTKEWWIRRLLKMLRQLRQEMGWHPIHGALPELVEGIYDGMEE
jgi:hypothetical protein